MFAFLRRWRGRPAPTSLPLKTRFTVPYAVDLAQIRRRFEDVFWTLTTPDPRQHRRISVADLTGDGVVFEFSWWNQAHADPSTSVSEVDRAMQRAVATW